MAEQEGTLLTAAERRADVSLKVDIGGGKFVMAKKLDMAVMVLEGLMPMPLLNAVQKMIEANVLKDPIGALAQTTDEERKEMVETMRKYAVAAVVSPRLSAYPDEKGTLPVVDLTLDELVKIWNATAMIPLLEATEATRFRARSSANNAVAVPASDPVPPSPEPVAAASPDQPAQFDRISQ